MKKENNVNNLVFHVWISSQPFMGERIHELVTRETAQRYADGDFYDFCGGAEDEQQFNNVIDKHLIIAKEKTFSHVDRDAEIKEMQRLDDERCEQMYQEYLEEELRNIKAQRAN